MTVINMWHGAATDSSFKVNAKVSGKSARLMVGSRAYGPVLASPEGVVSLEATNLQPRTEYRYQVEVDGVLDAENVGRLRTLPAAGAPQSFRFGTASCAGQNTWENGTFWPPTALKATNVSNGPVFDIIRDYDPAFFVHTGDLHYRDIGTNEVSKFRQAYDDVLSAPRQAALYRNVPIAYMYDDHDFGQNDANGDSPSAPAAKQAYRERVPHYPLGDSEGVWQTFDVGRVRFVLTDLRAYSSNYRDTDSPAKTLMGAKQKQWFKNLLVESDDKLICWFNTVPWHPTTNQLTNWSNYTHERDELAEFIDVNGIGPRMFMVSGDWHGMGFDDGSNNPWGDFPVYHCAPLDAKPSATLEPMPFSHGSSIARQQWGLFTIADEGESIRVVAEGKIGANTALLHSFTWRDSDKGNPHGPAKELVQVERMHIAGSEAKMSTSWGGVDTPVLAIHVGAISD